MSCLIRVKFFMEVIMKLSLNFVKDYIDLLEDLTVEQIAEDMT